MTDLNRKRSIRCNAWLRSHSVLMLAAALSLTSGSAHGQQPAESQPPTAVADEASQLKPDNSPEPLVDNNGFVLASSGRPLQLPADHRSHAETGVEWWYLTGPLTGPDGEQFGFQATWFRRGMVADVPDGRSPLATRDVILFHGALTDVNAGTLTFAESASRAYPPWAKASTEKLEVHLFDQQLVDKAGQGLKASLSINLGETQLLLDLDLQSSATLLHGEEPGLSVKGHEPGQASWYYSLPTVSAQGQLLRSGQPPLPVTGRAWLDHEFGSGPLASDQVGWDWFATVLDDGTEFMVYQLRRDDGSPATTSALSLRQPGGQLLHIGQSGFRITPLSHWTSPASNATYPSSWLLEVFDPPLTLRVSPEVADQELITTSTGVTYWEGLCRFEGLHNERPVQGLGYVELVGYAGSVADRFHTQDDF
ncbi:MAG: putative secreted hydrolase [Pseudohongiellaceae bacterium]|jgi:predicted secreted hydrolase